MEYQHEWPKPTTLYTLIERETGSQYDAPTGELRCDQCGMTALHIEHIPHLAWCQQAEQPRVDVSPRPWLTRGRPPCTRTPSDRPGTDPRWESALHAATCRVRYPLDHGRPGVDYVSALLEAAGDYHDWRSEHDYNDLDWRIDDRLPAELNAGRQADPGT